MKPVASEITARQFFDAMVVMCREHQGMCAVTVNDRQVFHRSGLDTVYESGNGNNGEAFVDERGAVEIGPGLIDDPVVVFKAHMTDNGALHFLSAKYDCPAGSRIFVEMYRHMNDSVMMLPRPLGDVRIHKEVALSRSDMEHLGGDDVLKDDGEGHALVVNVDLNELLFQSDKLLSAVEDLFTCNRPYANGHVELSSGCSVRACLDSYFFDPCPNPMLVATDAREAWMEVCDKNDSEIRYAIDIKKLIERTLENEGDKLLL